MQCTEALLSDDHDVKATLSDFINNDTVLDEIFDVLDVRFVVLDNQP